MVHGLKYHNLFEYLEAKVKEGKLDQIDKVTEREFRDALMRLEEDGVIT